MTQQFNAADLFRRVAPEVAARFAFRMPPNLVAEREAEIAGVMRPKRGAAIAPVGYVSPMARLSSLEKRRDKMRQRHEHVRRLHSEGRPAHEIAMACEVVVETIRKDMKALGLKPIYRPFNRMDMSLRRKSGVQFCRDNPGASIREICERFDVSDYTARTYRREART